MSLKLKRMGMKLDVSIYSLRLCLRLYIDTEYHITIT